MGKKALIIDDNANNLTLEKDLLETAGFEVFTAGNAASGIALPGRRSRISSSWICGFPT